MAIKKNVREEVSEMAKREVLIPEKVVSVESDPIYEGSSVSGSIGGSSRDFEDFPERDNEVLSDEEKEALAFALHWLDFFSKGSRNVEFRKGVKNFKNLFSKFQ